MFMKLNKIYFIFNILFYFVFGFSAISNSQILDITTPAKQVIINDHEANEILFEKNSTLYSTLISLYPCDL